MGLCLYGVRWRFHRLLRGNIRLQGRGYRHRRQGYGYFSEWYKIGDSDRVEEIHVFRIVGYLSEQSHVAVDDVKGFRRGWIDGGACVFVRKFAPFRFFRARDKPRPVVSVPVENISI